MWKVGRSLVGELVASSEGERPRLSPALGLPFVFCGKGLYLSWVEENIGSHSPTGPSFFSGYASCSLISLQALGADCLSSDVASSLPDSTWIACMISSGRSGAGNRPTCFGYSGDTGLSRLAAGFHLLPVRGIQFFAGLRITLSL
jgi:hypothetical protein